MICFELNQHFIVAVPDSFLFVGSAVACTRTSCIPGLTIIIFVIIIVLSLDFVLFGTGSLHVTG